MIEPHVHRYEPADPHDRRRAAHRRELDAVEEHATRVSRTLLQCIPFESVVCIRTRSPNLLAMRASTGARMVFAFISHPFVFEPGQPTIKPSWDRLLLVDVEPS